MYRFFASIFSVLIPMLTAACAAPPADLDLALTRTTVDKTFVVTLQPPTTPAAINQIHTWQIKVASPSGAPISHARIAVDGGMPQHGHGLPTRPQATQEMAEGIYLLEGMKFSMTGWWEIKLAIQSAQGSDNVTFNTVVAEPTVAR